MKNVLNVKFVSRASFAALLSFALSVQAIVDINKVPSLQLQNVVPGSLVQTVEDIPDKSKLSVFYNDLLLTQKMMLPGWNSSKQKSPNDIEIIEAFGIRTTVKTASPNAPQSLFFVGKGVGRSGVWEKERVGDSFAVIDGRPLKGLTIKGYGGNASTNRPQPDGSLDVAEAYRDTVLSKILMETGADTYIGALAVVRPNQSNDTQANYIRLSRSSLRLNDVMDRQGVQLEATLDHLQSLVAEELGAKPTVEEFTNWLVKRSAQTLARKEHARVTASNHNKDNFGIAELVDFGEAEYKPFNFEVNADVNGKAGSSWNSGLKKHVLEAAKNISSQFNFSGDFPTLFEGVYNTEQQRLIRQDAARIILDVASKNELNRIGLSDLTVERILRLQKELAFGILTIDDVLTKVAMTASEKKLIKQNATTQSMKLSDGHILSNVVVAEIGGAEGLREVLLKTMSQLSTAELAQEKIVASKVAANIKEKMQKIGTDRFANTYGSYGPNVAGNISRQLGEKISSNSMVWNTQYELATQKSAGLKCGSVF